MVLLNDIVYSLLHAADTKFAKRPIGCHGDGTTNKGNRVFYFVEDDFFTTHKLFSFGIIVGHLIMFYSYVVMYQQVPYYTMIWASLIQLYISISLSAGVHMLWSHRSYEASWPLKVFYMVGFSLCGQYTLFTWARDHRCHHKWSDSDADPHNPRRGSFFAHLGFVLHRRHPAALEKGWSLSYDDLSNDPVVKFHTKYCVPMYILVGMIIPTAIPVVLWDEDIVTAILVSYATRSIVVLHNLLLINSAAHVFGEKPYNAKIGATDNPWVSAFTMGAGYHNFHHTFPQDYRSSEQEAGYNVARDFINLMAHFGLAFNLKWTNKGHHTGRQGQSFGQQVHHGARPSRRVPGRRVHGQVGLGQQQRRPLVGCLVLQFHIYLIYL
ncbi:Delta(9)-fatty-acid desaturase fat-6 [Halotydeus destructor]|nr:Delta(9)-fatty-acid desaturase fat-6 [Halotydeus destructor]